MDGRMDLSMFPYIPRPPPALSSPLVALPCLFEEDRYVPACEYICMYDRYVRKVDRNAFIPLYIPRASVYSLMRLQVASACSLVGAA